MCAFVWENWSEASYFCLKQNVKFSNESISVYVRVRVRVHAHPDSSKKAKKLICWRRHTLLRWYIVHSTSTAHSFFSNSVVIFILENIEQIESMANVWIASNQNLLQFVCTRFTYAQNTIAKIYIVCLFSSNFTIALLLCTLQFWRSLLLLLFSSMYLKHS